MSASPDGVDDGGKTVGRPVRVEAAAAAAALEARARSDEKEGAVAALAAAGGALAAAAGAAAVACARIVSTASLRSRSPSARETASIVGVPGGPETRQQPLTRRTKPPACVTRVISEWRLGL